MQASTAIANAASSTNSARHRHRTRANPVLEASHTNDQNTTHLIRSSFFQPKLQVNQINDPYEVEADRVADEVTQSIYSDADGYVPPSAPAGDGEGGALLQRLSFFQRKPAFESPTELDINSANGSDIQRSAVENSVNAPPVHNYEEDVSEEGSADIYRKTELGKYIEGREVDRRFESRLSRSKGGGTGMHDKTRSQMESAFGADFSSVRIHTDTNATSLNNQVQAHAFTHGSDIYFNEGTYNPDGREGTRLLAHELTHVVQQGGAQIGTVQRRANVQVNQNAPAMVQRGIISRARNWAADKANNLPGYAMLTVVLGFNPINGADVPRNAANIFRAIMGFMPGGDLIWKALNNHGIFDQVGGWIVQQFEALRAIGSSIKSAFWEFVDSLGLSDLAPWNIGGLWRRAKRIFTVPIKKIIAFIKGLVTDIIKFIKDAILKPLARLAEGTRAWDLLIAILGRNPITGDPVPRTADTLIGGFMKLIGQEEIWQNIKRGNAIARAWAWFQGAMGSLIALVSSIPTRFINALKSLKIIDIVLVPRAFAKIVGVFAGFAVDFASWAGNAMWELLKIIFVVVAPGAMPWLEKAGGALRSIFQNPGSFLGNLVAAGKLGFEIFKENIGSILKEVLIDWLTGTLEGAGIYIPQGLTFPEILKFVLSVLGLTWENIRAKLVEHFGEGPVTVLEEGFELVQILVTEGPAAAWEKIQEHLSNLQETIIGEIITWVSKTVVAKAVIKIVSSLNPVGGFIQAILTIWGVIKVFIQRIRKIIQVGVAFMNSIMEIASGNIMPAAMKVVITMKGILVLAVSFLAEFAGLGKIGEALQNILKKIRDPIDKAMDKMILWVKNKAKGFLKKKDDEEHAQIIGQAINDMKQGDVSGKTYDQVRAEKDGQARQIEQKYQPQLKENVKITISFTAPETDKEDSDLDFTVTIAPNTSSGSDAIIVLSPTSAEDLSAAKAQFGNIDFAPGELKAFLVENRGIGMTTANTRVRDWKSANELFSYESSKTDRAKRFAFDKSALPEGPRPVRANNRSTYGYSNPSHTSATGIAVIGSSTAKIQDPSSPTGYKFNYVPGKESDLAYLSSGRARFEDHFDKSNLLQWGNVVMGHRPPGASGNWNAEGHKRHKSENIAWNKEAKNYHGTEDPAKSAATGGKAVGYNEPIPKPVEEGGSHPMWWDPNHDEYAG